MRIQKIAKLLGAVTLVGAMIIPNAFAENLEVTMDVVGQSNAKDIEHTISKEITLPDAATYRMDAETGMHAGTASQMTGDVNAMTHEHHQAREQMHEAMEEGYAMHEQMRNTVEDTQDTKNHMNDMMNETNQVHETMQDTMMQNDQARQNVKDVTDSMPHSCGHNG